MYELKVKMTEKDLIDYNIFHAENSKSMRKTLFFLRIMFPVLCFPMAVFWFDKLVISSWIILSVVTVLFYVKTPAIMRLSTNRRIKRMLKEGKNGDMFLDKTINIDHLGIKLETPNTSVFYKWENIFRIMESDTSLYIYVSSIQAIAIPKRFMGTEELISEIKEFINKNMKNDF